MQNQFSVTANKILNRNKKRELWNQINNSKSVKSTIINWLYNNMKHTQQSHLENEKVWKCETLNYY